MSIYDQITFTLKERVKGFRTGLPKTCHFGKGYFELNMIKIQQFKGKLFTSPLPA